MTTKKIVSLGGVGGCDLADALRKLNQETFPFDWLITSQSFVINSINSQENFFTFEDNYVYNRTMLLEKNNKAIMLHDFKNWTLDKQTVIDKYSRRFNRLNTLLNSNEDILFVRIFDNLLEPLEPSNFYDNIFIREEEQISIWNNFITNLRLKYSKNIHLLIISSFTHIESTIYDNITVINTTHHQNSDYIQTYIKDTVNKF